MLTIWCERLATGPYQKNTRMSVRLATGPYHKNTPLAVRLATGPYHKNTPLAVRLEPVILRMQIRLFTN